MDCAPHTTKHGDECSDTQNRPTPREAARCGRLRGLDHRVTPRTCRLSRRPRGLAGLPGERSPRDVRREQLEREPGSTGRSSFAAVYEGPRARAASPLRLRGLRARSSAPGVSAGTGWPSPAGGPSAARGQGAREASGAPHWARARTRGKGALRLRAGACGSVRGRAQP